jgi:hypothetical protein
VSTVDKRHKTKTVPNKTTNPPYGTYRICFLYGQVKAGLSKKIQWNVHLQSVPYHGSSVAYILVAHSSFNINIELPGGPSVLQRNSGVKVKSFTNPISSEQSFAKASFLSSSCPIGLVEEVGDGADVERARIAIGQGIGYFLSQIGEHLDSRKRSCEPTKKGKGSRTVSTASQGGDRIRTCNLQVMSLMS